MRTTPPAVRPITGCAKLHTITVQAQQARTDTIGFFNAFVHDNNIPQTHRFDIIVRELLTDETGQFGVRLRELALGGLGVNLLRNPVVVLEETAPKNGDFGRHAVGRLEVCREEHLLGVVSNAFESGDPVLAGRSVAGNRKVNDAIFLAPRTVQFGNQEFVAEKTERHVAATELLDDGIVFIYSEIGRCKPVTITHNFLLALICAFCFSSQLRKDYATIRKS